MTLPFRYRLLAAAGRTLLFIGFLFKADLLVMLGTIACGADRVEVKKT